ncbi:hypothetical protein MNEG_2315 [Monoraphidium neglectum]|uniref:Cytochrome b5 heme-binding domain-containing protein n=1 Tax=Monoraphidium neglectum TaxID=145388 RepID=A0A0D2NLY0_9CHLO|nr:hypothetical protein MNEG_2315 [Monoraphidium neglectum]KIZ05646.1 hypothetical protein MNEG_2315 [Monoraphidium neglectum]|eukprot:XP_013904665.1 hypothetical protein MNEG_2315 [Monoraphidium neglectum]
MQESRQRRPPEPLGGPQRGAVPRAVPLAPPRRGGIRGLPLLAVLGVALLALRLGVRVVTLVKTRGAAVEAANQQQEQQQRLQQSDSRKAQAPSVLSKAQLAQADGSDGRPVYLSILGDVFDVSSKPEFYGKGSGYHHFVGTDGSRAFVTGEFEGPPRAEVLDLSPEDVHGIVGWRDFYFRTYPHKGRAEGLYYTAAGEPTDTLRQVEARAAEGARLKEEKAKEVAKYTSCGMKYTTAEGGKVWCETGMYPRKLFDGMDGGAASFRCVCMNDIGWSDLLQVYPDCDPDSSTCQTAPPLEES